MREGKKIGMPTIPTDRVTIMTVNIGATGLVRCEKTLDRSLVVDEGNYDAGFAVLLVDGFDVFGVREFYPVSALGLNDV